MSRSERLPQKSPRELNSFKWAWRPEGNHVRVGKITWWKVIGIFYFIHQL